MKNKRLIVQWGIIAIVTILMMVAGENQMLVREPTLFIVCLLIVSMALAAIFVFLCLYKTDKNKGRSCSAKNNTVAD